MLGSLFVILYTILVIYFWHKATLHFELEEKGMGYWNLFLSAVAGASILNFIF